MRVSTVVVALLGVALALPSPQVPSTENSVQPSTENAAIHEAKPTGPIEDSLDFYSDDDSDDFDSEPEDESTLTRRDVTDGLKGDSKGLEKRMFWLSGRRDNHKYKDFAKYCNAKLRKSRSRRKQRRACKVSSTHQNDVSWR
jgi:hypothetical protein